MGSAGVLYEGNDARGQEWNQGIRRHERRNVVVPLLSEIWHPYRSPTLDNTGVVALQSYPSCRATPFKTGLAEPASELAPHPFCEYLAIALPSSR